MAGALHEFLSFDHARLDALLSRCAGPGRSIDGAAYDEFRRGLLRHIAIEEKVLFPELRKRKGDTELERRLHKDHAALAALLVPPPSPLEIGQIIDILAVHNELEETSGGLYEIIESLAAEDLDALMLRVHDIPQVRVAPNVDTPLVRSSIAQLLRERESS